MKLENCPRTQLEAIRCFSDPDVAHNFMVEMRWPNGVTCPHCQNTDVKFVKTNEKKPRRLWNCRGCEKQFTAKVGTIFEDSPIGFEKWLPAIWMVVNCKNEISSCELARSLGVTQKTAWFMLHRIRHALQCGSVKKLSGTVEADETFIGGQAKNMHKGARKAVGLGPTGKAIVMGLLERNGPVRPRVIPDTRRGTLHAQIRRRIKTDTVHEQGSFRQSIH